MKYRVGTLTAIAATAALALAPANASAQEPCTMPNPITVPDAVNCAADTALWAVNQANPGPLIENARRIVLGAIQQASDEAFRIIEDADGIEQDAIDTVCFILFKAEPGECTSF